MDFFKMSDETLLSLQRDGINIEKIVSRERYEDLKLISTNTVTTVTDTVIIKKKGLIKRTVDKVKENRAERKAKKDNN